MKAEFKLTAGDFADAQRTHLRNALGRKVLWLLVFIAFVMLAYTWALFHPSDELFAELKPVGYLALGLVLVATYVWSGFASRKQFRNTPEFRSQFTIETSAEGVNFTSANGQSHTRWQGFVDLQESKNSFLLYTQRNLFFILPKRAFQPEEISLFREVAKSHIPRS